MELTNDQYEQVLKYMETAGEDNFDQAVATMHRHRFDLQTAINSRFHQAHPHSPPNPADDQEIVRKYIEFTRKKNEEWSLFAVLLNLIWSILVSLFNVLIALIPSSLRVRYLGSSFEKLYSSKLKQGYSHRRLQDLLRKTKNLDARSVLLVISPKRQNADITALLNDSAIRKRIGQGFFLCGYVVEHGDISQLEGSNEGPLVIALRWNIFEELVELGRERNLKRISLDVLGRWAHEGRNRFKRDGNVLVKYRNYIARFHGLHYEEDEEEEVNLAQRETYRQEMHQQNQAYLQAEEQTRRNKEAERERQIKQEEERRAQEEQEEERKMRKMSIPDEPSSGNIVRISFRCPDGSTIVRNFLATQKIELIFHWVQLNDAIEFEDPSRRFQILHSYPPQPLSSQQDKLLSEVFESEQEKVVVREL